MFLFFSFNPVTCYCSFFSFLLGFLYGPPLRALSSLSVLFAAAAVVLSLLSFGVVV
jgi:hypothetical protein